MDLLRETTCAFIAKAVFKLPSSEDYVEKNGFNKSIHIRIRKYELFKCTCKNIFWASIDVVI